jgi:hypothetical protein
LIDEMKEGARHGAIAEAAAGDGPAAAILNAEQPFTVLADYNGIVELMACSHLAPAAQNAITEKLSAAIAQMKRPRRKACLQANEPEHGVPSAFCIDKAIA